MATQKKKKPTILGVPGKDYDVLELPEAASQSFEEGEFVYLSGNKVTVCADDAGEIAGLALEPASGTTDTNIKVAVPRPGCKFLGTVYHSTEASAITAIGQRGTRYGLQVDSNIHYVDIEDTANLAFLITDIAQQVGYSIGDVYGQVIFEVLGEVNQLSGRDNA